MCKRLAQWLAGWVRHHYPFDPTHGYDLAALERVTPAPAPPDFDDFWAAAYRRALELDPAAELERVDALTYSLTMQSEVPIGGWLRLPRSGRAERALVITHGYGGRSDPDVLSDPNTAALFPVLRGLPSRSLRPDIPAAPVAHVLHGIAHPHTYVLGGCVVDVWVAVTVLTKLFPGVPIGYCGTSFGGGIGALATAFDPRISRSALILPTFGHHRLRQRLPAVGSLLGLHELLRRLPDAGEVAPDLGLAPMDGAAELPSPLPTADQVRRTLELHDAATAATRITVPTLVAPAVFDPAVPPAGQFAVANGLAGPVQRQVLPAGHHDYPQQRREMAALALASRRFFGAMGD